MTGRTRKQRSASCGHRRHLSNAPVKVLCAVSRSKFQWGSPLRSTVNRSCVYSISTIHGGQRTLRMVLAPLSR
jgi:hypothetical protein